MLSDSADPELMNESDSIRVRMHAHSILLSAEGYSIDEIADIYHADRDSVSSLIDRWEQSGTEGLYGKPPKLTGSEVGIVMAVMNYPAASSGVS